MASISPPQPSRKGQGRTFSSGVGVEKRDREGAASLRLNLWRRGRLGQPESGNASEGLGPYDLTPFSLCRQGVGRKSKRMAYILGCPALNHLGPIQKSLTPESYCEAR